MLPDVWIKMEIIDFLQPRIKQKLTENTITPEKCVIAIDYVQSSLQCVRMIFGACFGLGLDPFAQDMVIKTRIVLELDISQDGFLQTNMISESS